MLVAPGFIQGDLAAAGAPSDDLGLFGRGGCNIGFSRCSLNGSTAGVPTTPGEPNTNIGASGSAGASDAAVLSAAGG